LLQSVIDRHLAADLRALADDPSPIVAALEPFPHTLVHGDLRPANLGVVDEPEQLVARAIVIDWARVTFTAPAVDLAWYLVATARELPISRDDAIARYEDALEQRLGVGLDRTWWLPQREISLLAGALQMAPFMAIGATAGVGDRSVERMALGWWADRMRAALP